MRPILEPCVACLAAHLHPPRHGLYERGPLCATCNGVGVLIRVTINPLDRQIIDAWWAEPLWHFKARNRAQAAGRPGFFQPRP